MDEHSCLLLNQRTVGIHTHHFETKGGGGGKKVITQSRIKTHFLHKAHCLCNLALFAFTFADEMMPKFVPPSFFISNTQCFGCTIRTEIFPKQFLLATKKKSSRH